MRCVSCILHDLYLPKFLFPFQFLLKYPQHFNNHSFCTSKFDFLNELKKKNYLTKIYPGINSFFILSHHIIFHHYFYELTFILDFSSKLKKKFVISKYILCYASDINSFLNFDFLIILYTLPVDISSGFWLITPL